MKKNVFILLLLNLGAFAQDPQSLITAFSQGEATNCASISAIKLAISEFGPDGVLSKCEKTAAGYHVVLRDDSIVDISTSELETMTSKNRFKLGDDKRIYDYAKYLYAVMAKRKQQIYGMSRIGRAATHNLFYHQLSMDTKENLHFLGLDRYVKKVRKEYVNQQQKVIITNRKHSAYGASGQYDEFGTPTPNARFGSLHGGSEINDDDNYILTD